MSEGAKSSPIRAVSSTIAVSLMAAIAKPQGDVIL